jgi:hypothetical protein
MKISSISLHPDFIEDGKHQAFRNGTDIALAVAEIPQDKFRLIEDKVAF